MWTTLDQPPDQFNSLCVQSCCLNLATLALRQSDSPSIYSRRVVSLPTACCAIGLSGLLSAPAPPFLLPNPHILTFLSTACQCGEHPILSHLLHSCNLCPKCPILGSCPAWEQPMPGWDHCERAQQQYQGHSLGDLRYVPRLPLPPPPPVNFQASC